MFEALTPLQWRDAHLMAGQDAPRLERGAGHAEPMPAAPKAFQWVSLAGAACLAVLLHGAAFAALTLALVHEISRSGALGTEPEAISVEMVSTTDLLAQSRAARPDGGGVASPSSEAVTDAAPSAAAATDRTEPPAALAGGQAILATSEAAESVVATNHEPTPRHADQMQERLTEAPPEQEPIGDPTPNLSEQAVVPSPPTVATPEQAVTAIGSTPALRPPVAAASPGAMRAYAKSVVAALGRTSPRQGVVGIVRGTVRIAFVISIGGELESVRVARSSGALRLDEAAISAVRLARFPSPPAGMTLGERTYEIPYTFR